jgi:hypothetical protein
MLLSAVVPLPSCPYALKPQHFTPPPDVSAQLKASPLAIAATPLDKPTTSTGAAENPDDSPFPSCPA